MRPPGRALGTCLLQAMLDGVLLAGGDGRFDSASAREDQLAVHVTDEGYRGLRDRFGLEL